MGGVVLSMAILHIYFYLFEDVTIDVLQPVLLCH